MAGTIERQGFLPTFSLRWFAFYFTLSVGFAWIIRQSLNGGVWAMAIVHTFVGASIFFVIYAIVFLLIWIPARHAAEGYDELDTDDDFSENRLPPQVIPPNDHGVAN